ncbi:MAG: hypothetical protein HC900_06825 [Methylacidiphilales bacterium]|nr:hypothetical protein [Candidatus Methylacidiphilales bacterium]
MIAPTVDEHLDRAVVLAVFVPLIISSGGNTGTQAAENPVKSEGSCRLTAAESDVGL